jgi:hypothetical protein
MNPEDLQIIFHRSMTKWLWVIEDLQGEQLAFGSAVTWGKATEQALGEFDRFVNEKGSEHQVTHGTDPGFNASEGVIQQLRVVGATLHNEEIKPQ